MAANQHGELHLRSVRQPLSYFINGFLMINFGLILGACPIRIVLLSAYGNWLGIIGWVCIVIGVLVGTWVLALELLLELSNGGKWHDSLHCHPCPGVYHWLPGAAISVVLRFRLPGLYSYSRHHPVKRG